MQAFVRKLAISPNFLLVSAFVMLAGHIRWALVTHDGANLARCGALWVIWAAVLIARPVIRKGYSEWFESSKIIGGGHFEPSKEELEEERENALDMKCVQVFGPTLAILGTLFWGLWRHSREYSRSLAACRTYPPKSPTI